MIKIGKMTFPFYFILGFICYIANYKLLITSTKWNNKLKVIIEKGTSSMEIIHSPALCPGILPIFLFIHITIEVLFTLLLLFRDWLPNSQGSNTYIKTIYWQETGVTSNYNSRVNATLLNKPWRADGQGDVIGSPWNILLSHYMYCICSPFAHSAFIFTVSPFTERSAFAHGAYIMISMLFSFVNSIIYENIESVYLVCQESFVKDIVISLQYSFCQQI